MKRLVVFMCVLIFGFCVHAEINPFWSLGMFSLEGSLSQSTAQGSAIMDVGEFYFVECNTQLTLKISPCHLTVFYDSEKTDNKNSSFPWRIESGYLVNAELEWNHPVGEYFIFTPFMGINAVNPLSPSDVTGSCGLEMSWAMPMEPLSDLSYPMFSKIVAISGGVRFLRTENLTSSIFFSVGINLGIWLWGINKIES